MPDALAVWCAPADGVVEKGGGGGGWAGGGGGGGRGGGESIFSGWIQVDGGVSVGPDPTPIQKRWTHRRPLPRGRRGARPPSEKETRLRVRRPRGFASPRSRVTRDAPATTFIFSLAGRFRCFARIPKL